MPRLILLLLLAALLSGCATNRPLSTDFPVPAGGYIKAFDEARDVLIGMRFELDRVDAAAGVITTQPKHTAGLATPWDAEQSTLEQEWEDLVNEQERRVRITFEPAEATAGEWPDLREYTGPMTGHVEVAIDRVHHAGWRLETTSIRYSTYTIDPTLIDRQMWPLYSVPFSQDRLLADELAEKIERKTLPKR
jgi:hypothetical protein